MSKILPENDFKVLLEAYQQHEMDTDRAAQLAITKEIIEKYPGVDLNATSEKYSVSLFDSLFYGCHSNFNIPVFAYLVEKGLRPFYSNKNRQSPLTTAVAYNSYDLCELFLTHGADPNETNHLDGRSPLFRAVQHYHPWVVKLLLKHGADPNGRVYCPHAPALNDMPLWYAFVEETYRKQTCHNKKISFWGAFAMLNMLRVYGLDLSVPHPATGENFTAWVNNHPDHPDYKQLQNYARKLELRPPVAER